MLVNLHGLWIRFLIHVYFCSTMLLANLFTNEQMQTLHDLSTLLHENTPQYTDHHKNNERRKFRILCFGDSLTQGYYGVYKHYHPYSFMLRKLLAKNYGDNKFDVTTAGVGGERVHKEMYHRLKTILKEQTFDLLIIMGGVNDLSTLDCVDKINLYEDIKLLHNLAHSHSIRTVVMTILEARVADSKLLILNQKQFQRIRSETNKKLRQINSSMSVLCDTATEFPLDGLSTMMRSYIWTKDNVHPTPNGYDELGRVIFECVNTMVDLPT